MTRIVVGLVVMVIIMISIPILLAWSQSRRRPRVEAVGGVAVLRMPRGHWAIMATIAVIPFAAISVPSFLVAWRPGAEASGFALGVVMGLAGLCFGGYLAALEVRGGLRLDDGGIEKVGAFGRRRLAWAEVSKITFNPVNNWFFLTGPDGRTIYFGEGLSGISTFAERALQRLPPKVLEAAPDAVEALQELAGL